MEKSVTAIDHMTGSLLEHLSKGNLVMSTLSIANVMGMVLAGANNDTRDQILAALRHQEVEEVSKGLQSCLKTIKTLQDSGNFTLRAANRVYTEKAFQPLPEFNSHLSKFFEAEPLALDFARDPEGSRGSINAWVEDQTNKKIVDLLASGSINSMTRMVLVNALYFKGDWAHKFDPNDTEEDEFFVDEDKVVKVQMMHQKEKFGIATIKALNGATALRMPYKGERLDMIIILPHEQDTLESMEKKLAGLDLKQHLNKFSTSGKVIVSLPKFKVESNHNLNGPLESIGIKDLFQANQADLSGISGDKSLFVSLVVQKAFVEVNEEGAEAAAATAAVMRMMAMMEPTFECNRPFHFMIRERESGLVLFSGRVTDPSI